MHVSQYKLVNFMRVNLLNATVQTIKAINL